MDYETFFDLAEDPFSNVPDSRFYFDSEENSQILKRLSHVVEKGRGLGVLLGDVGTGKTMLARQMLHLLQQNGNYEAGLLVLTHPEFSPLWLLSKVAQLLGISKVSEERAKLMSVLYQRLLKIHQEGKKAVVVIDEANMLQNQEVMEEIRGLLNLEVSNTRLICFLLFGLMELEKYLSLNESLNQRVAMKYKLEPLKPDQVQTYIFHRLQIAGRKDELFTDKALGLISDYSRGIPRLINTICDNALIEGYLRKKKLIDVFLVEKALLHLGLTRER